MGVCGQAQTSMLCGIIICRERSDVWILLRSITFYCSCTCGGRWCVLVWVCVWDVYNEFPSMMVRKYVIPSYFRTVVEICVSDV